MEQTNSSTKINNTLCGEQQVSESPGLKLSEESIQSDSISNFSKSSVKTYVENKKNFFWKQKTK